MKKETAKGLKRLVRTISPEGMAFTINTPHGSPLLLLALLSLLDVSDQEAFVFLKGSYRPVSCSPDE